MLPECYYCDHHESTAQSWQTALRSEASAKVIRCFTHVHKLSTLKRKLELCCLCPSLIQRLEAVITSRCCRLELRCLGNTLTRHHSVPRGCGIGRAKEPITSAGCAAWCSLASPVLLIQQQAEPASSPGSGQTACYCSDRVSYNHGEKERKGFYKRCFPCTLGASHIV